MNPPILRLTVALLVAAYLFALAMSAGHLAEWYSLSLGGLPAWFAVGLAASLELTAFLLSLISNALRASPWATWGAVLALSLVWVGNLLSMGRANPHLPLWEVLLMSLFVPVATLVVGKVLGDLVRQSPSVPISPRPSSPVSQPLVSPFQPPMERPEPANVDVPADRPPAEQRPTFQQTHERLTFERSTTTLTLEPAHRTLLEHLAQEALGVSELARRTEQAKSSVSRWLARMAERGLVEQRDTLWHLTEQGRQTLGVERG